MTSLEKCIEIVKLWNSKKGTKYQISRDGSPSAIVTKLQVCMESCGDEKVVKYFDYLLKDELKTDIWNYVNIYTINKWIEPVEVKVEVKEEKKELNILSALSSELIILMGTELANKINDEVENKLNKFVQDKTLIKVVEYKNERKPIEGIVHNEMETILQFVAMDEPVMLVGPAGTGKNVICKQVADALGLEFYFSNAITQEYKLTGFVDAMGNFVKTQFYEAFTKGGLFLLDEMDGSIPEVLIVLNCAIANRYFDFPGIGRVNAHENFRIIACANTYGTGASMEYVGRNQLDGASLNRFAIVEVDYDSKIEESVSGGNKDVLEFCREFRNACRKNGVNHIVSYREISRLHKMIDVAKMDIAKAIKCCLVKGLEKDTLRMIENNMSNSVKYKANLKEIIEK